MEQLVAAAAATEPGITQAMLRFYQQYSDPYGQRARQRAGEVKEEKMEKESSEESVEG